MIDIKKYYEHPVREFNGNPLINYMPYFSRDHLREMMRSHVEYDPSDITHDWELRLSYPQRLLQLYMPQDHQLDWAMSLVALWQRNYMLRNPTRPPVAKQFYDLCDSIVRGKPVSDPNASFLDSPWCAVVIGTPGSGKSATCKALLSVLGPGVFWHSQHGGLFQLLSVRVQAPTSGSGKTLAKEVFIKLRDAARSTGQTFQFMSDKVPDSRTDLEHAITVLAKRLNLGVLVLDELQHLFRGSAGMDEDSMEFLTGVINRLGIPVVMIGTWKAKDALINSQVERSATGQHTARGDAN